MGIVPREPITTMSGIVTMDPVGPATSEESLDSDGATGKQHRIGGGEMVDLATEEQ